MDDWRRMGWAVITSSSTSSLYDLHAYTRDGYGATLTAWHSVIAQLLRYLVEQKIDK